MKDSKLCRAPLRPLVPRSASPILSLLPIACCIRLQFVAVGFRLPCRNRGVAQRDGVKFVIRAFLELIRGLDDFRDFDLPHFEQAARELRSRSTVSSALRLVFARESSDLRLHRKPEPGRLADHPRLQSRSRVVSDQVAEQVSLSATAECSRVTFLRAS